MYLTLCQLTLFITISMEESRDMECLRTPRGAGARGAHAELRVYEGTWSTRCSSPVSSITWMSVRRGDGIIPSVKRETRELSLQLQPTSPPSTLLSWNMWIVIVFSCSDLFLPPDRCLFPPWEASRLRDTASSCSVGLFSSALSFPENF